MCVCTCHSFWDATFAPPLFEDKVAKNMLYIEALAAVSRGHIDLSAEVREKLAALKSKGQKKEVAHVQRYCAIVSRALLVTKL